MNLYSDLSNIWSTSGHYPGFFLISLYSLNDEEICFSAVTTCKGLSVAEQCMFYITFSDGMTTLFKQFYPEGPIDQ